MRSVANPVKSCYDPDPHPEKPKWGLDKGCDFLDELEYMTTKRTLKISDIDNLVLVEFSGSCGGELAKYGLDISIPFTIGNAIILQAQLESAIKRARASNG